MISSGHTESGSGALPGFVFWRVVSKSARIKSPEILTSVAIGVLQLFDISF